jgi:Right handed beta helix region
MVRPNHREVEVPVRGLVVLAATAMALALWAAPPAAALECGQVISADRTLRKDLSCDPGSSGLAIGADGVKLDLNGHTISGASESGTAGVLAIGRKRVQVVDGEIRGFGNAFVASASRNLALRRLDARDAADETVHLGSVEGATVAESRLRAPGSQQNVLVDGASADVTVIGNLMRGGKIDFDQGQGLRAIANTLNSPVLGGIDIRDVDGAVVRGNEVVDPGIAAGIAVTFEAENTTIARNSVDGGFSTGIFAGVQSNQVTIARNEVRATDGSGILAGAMSTGVVVRGNLVRRANLDGITINDDDALIEGNTANRNIDYGIESVSANGSGNVAKHNGNPAQCTPASLCAPAQARARR